MIHLYYKRIVKFLVTMRALALYQYEVMKGWLLQAQWHVYKDKGQRWISFNESTFSFAKLHKRPRVTPSSDWANLQPFAGQRSPAYNLLSENRSRTRLTNGDKRARYDAANIKLPDTGSISEPIARHPPIVMTNRNTAHTRIAWPERNPIRVVFVTARCRSVRARTNRRVHLAVVPI